MTSDGGGWTVVFLASTSNYQSDTIDYDIPVSNALWTGATDVLLAHRDAQKAPIGDVARFAIPANWKILAPFQYDATDDANVMVAINGAGAANRTVRYGRQNFTAFCGDGWQTSGTRWGRICVQDTTAPFFDGYTASTSDGCQTSAQGYGYDACSVSRLFSIAIR
jgi:hypothetical protein